MNTNVFYGARAPKLASILKCTVKQAEKYIVNFWEGNRGVKLLVDYLVLYYQKYGFLKGLDGRKIFIRAEYKLLNSLIQTAAAIVFKRWCVIANRELIEQSIDCKQIIAYHDELDYRCNNKCIEDATSIIKDSALRAGEYYNLNVPITVDVKVGRNWSQVH